LVVVRTERGLELLNKAERSNVIKLREVKCTIIKHSQNTLFKEGVFQRLSILKKLKRRIPKYSVKIRMDMRLPTLIYTLMCMPSFFSQNRRLWNIIYISSILRHFLVAICNKLKII